MPTLFGRWSRGFPARASLIAVSMLAAGGPALGAQDQGRGWGSSWTDPQTTEEKANQEKAQRLQNAMRTGDWATAEKMLAELARINPRSGYILVTRATVAIAQLRYDDALSYLDKGLPLLPKTAPQFISSAYLVRSYVYQLKGKFGAARSDLERAVSLNKANMAAQNGYAWLLATCPDASVRDGRKAVRVAKDVTRNTGNKNPGFIDTLAAAEAEAGDFRAAIKDEERALSIAGDKREIIQNHLEAFQQGQPLHLPPEPPQFRKTGATKS
jgi:tetratricopeptide (TPR) repeat protein